MREYVGVRYVNRGASAFILLFVLCSAFVLLTEIEIVYAGETIYIRIDGSIEGTNKIQRDGNVYTFTGDISDALVIERDNIVVDGAGHVLEGAGTGKGILLDGRSNVTIKNITIREFDFGIDLWNSSGNTISANAIANTSTGIYLVSRSDSNSISANNIANNQWGISLTGASNSSISANNIANNDVGISLTGASNNSISANNITNNNVYGISLSFSLYNGISANNIANNTYGIYLSSLSDSNNMSANNITNNHWGIWLFYSSNNSINKNNITANIRVSVFLGQSSNNIMSGNNVVNSPNSLNLSNSSNNNIIENNIANNGLGVWLSISSNNSISKNNITANSFWGVHLSASFNNSISENNIIATFDFSIWLDVSSNNNISKNIIANSSRGIFLSGSFSNTIYHNNFVNNIAQVYSLLNSTNVWDAGYPSGGNYWSDYSGVDLNSGPYQNETGSDGIGDLSYIIDSDNTDRYPLMGPISTFDCGSWDNKPYYAAIVSNSTISAFNFNATQKLISFNVNGSAGTMGFCKITIDNLLLGGPYTVLVDATPVTSTVTSNGTHSSLYFTYAHSTHNVTIIGTLVIPDSHSSLGLLMVMLVATSALLYMKKKRLAS